MTTTREWDAESVAEVTACYREAQAVHRTLTGQMSRLEQEVFRAEQLLRKAERLYERCQQETATVPEFQRQAEALVAERDQIAAAYIYEPANGWSR